MLAIDYHVLISGKSYPFPTYGLYVCNMHVLFGLLVRLRSPSFTIDIAPHILEPHLVYILVFRGEIFISWKADFNRE